MLDIPSMEGLGIVVGDIEGWRHFYGEWLGELYHSTLLEETLH